HLRVKLGQWCQAAVERTTADMDELEMHSAVRNLMRLFDRIKDFEKRVLAREPALSAANLEALIAALAVLVQMLGAFTPPLEELLPITDARAQARVGEFSGYTPLIRAERLGAELGIANLYIKDDSSQRPSFSYKDRVVSMSIARLLEKGKSEIGCVSTGNVGT